MKKNVILITLLLTLFFAATSFAQDYGVAAVGDSFKILPERERAQVLNDWLRWRLDNIIPEVMRRDGIDLWLVINREYNEDPVYMSMVPEPTMYARRCSILIFHDRGPELGVERLDGSYYAMSGWYQATWTDKSKTQFENLADVIKELNPQKIGINMSEHFAFGDGLSASLRDKLVQHLGPEMSKRLVSAENLCVGWLETRSPRELSVYRHICGIAHDLIAEFYSNKVITPDITTTEDVVWWIRQKITDLGLEAWFQPSISIQRDQRLAAQYPRGDQVIRRGDLLHCDVGIVYLDLCTDMQWHAYVCHLGEDNAPSGLINALDRANQLGNIFRGEFRLGRTGNEIVQSAMQKGQAAGLRPSIYSHPVGLHGHAAGPPMDARPHGSLPEGNQQRGQYPLHYNTVYAIEYSGATAVPEWNNQDVSIAYEETAAFTEKGCHFLDGHQTKLFLIK